MIHRKTDAFSFLSLPPPLYPYLGPGPTISGHMESVQNSEMVPYIRLMCSKNPIAENKIYIKTQIRLRNELCWIFKIDVNRLL